MKKKTIIILISFIFAILLISIGFYALNRYNAKKFMSSFESTIPVKEREEIKDPINSKYQSILIMQDSEDKENFGTGFIVGKNKLLTNAHVSDIFKENRLIVRSRNANGEFVDFKVKNVIAAPDDADLTIVEVMPTEDGKNISDGMQLLELAELDEINNIKVGDSVNTVGYPGDKDYGTLWNSEGVITSIGGNFVTYNTIIYGGNSGSPLFNEAGKVIGLSNASNNETGDKAITFGFLLTENLYNFVKSNI